MGGCGGQSIASSYGGASYVGPSAHFGTVDPLIPLRINLVPVPTNGIDPFIPAVFIITLISPAGLSAYNLRQGDASVAATSSDFQIAANSANGFIWRVDVNRAEEAFLSVLTPDGAIADALCVTRVDSLSAAGTP